MVNRSTRRALFRALASVPAAAAIAAGAVKRDVIVLSNRPEDFEMKLSGFKDWITPVEHFFVRSHHYTPRVKLEDWKLEVAGSTGKPLSLSMADLKAMPRVELVGVLECAGNGRGLYTPSMPGLQWKFGAVGNAKWAGVRLADVLRRAEIKPSAIEILFDGADKAVATQPEFQRAIPIKKALEPNTILAYEMNGAPLDPSHGFPLRVVVPGWAGDSWVKWITRIEARDTEFDGFFMKTGYRHPGVPVPPGSTVDPAKMKPVTSLRPKSVIASPETGFRTAIAPVKISGAAWAGESPIASVDVSTDNGRTWRPARLGTEKAQFAWRLWEFDWIPTAEGYFTVMSRARDAAGNTQPVADEWNPSGYQNNAIHKVAIHVTTGPPPLPVAAYEPPAWPDKFSACLACHGSEVMEQQKLTKSQWAAEVDKMGRWGSFHRLDLREDLIQFLYSNFGPK